MMKADTLKALIAARDAINVAILAANASSENQIPNGDVTAHQSEADVTVSADGKVTVIPGPRKVLLQDSEGFTKSATHGYWATAAGSACPRCGGSGRA